MSTTSTPNVPKLTVASGDKHESLVSSFEEFDAMTSMNSNQTPNHCQVHKRLPRCHRAKRKGTLQRNCPGEKEKLPKQYDKRMFPILLDYMTRYEMRRLE